LALMKIAVVGCGALGSFYGAKLCKSGQEVHFLLRSDFDAVRQNGVCIEDPDESWHVHPRCARVPAEIGPAALVLVCLKTTANAALPRLLPPLGGPDTVFLTLQNGLGNEEAIADLVRPDQIMGGMCFVCLNRVAPGRIRHIAHGAVVLGEYQGPPRERTEEIRRLFDLAGIRCKVAANLEQAHWEKLVWNIPFNGLGVAGAAGLDAILQGRIEPGTELGPCLTTDRLLADTQWKRLVRELMMETIVAARALGLDVPERTADRQLERTGQMGPYKASTLVDFERGNELELEGLFLEPLRRARQAGIACPRLSALCEVLAQLQALRGIPSRKKPDAPSQICP
jgi:2-dehydropantoate 2-reductase